jgi:hypothetical protein
LDAELGSNVRTLRRRGITTSSAGHRLRANWPARIEADGGRTDCAVINISHTGACVSLKAMAESVPLWLIVDGMAPISATIAWRKRDCVGLLFGEEQKWVEEASRRRFDPAAWVRDLS